MDPWHVFRTVAVVLQRADFWMLTLALTLAFSPGTPGVPSEVAQVRADRRAAPPTVPERVNPEEPPPFERARRFVPAATALPEDAPERTILDKIRSGKVQEAVAMARTALQEGNAPTTGIQVQLSTNGPISTTYDGGVIWDRNARLRWLLARALADLGKEAAAEGVLETLIATQHPLSPFARLRLGTLQLKRVPERAIRTLTPLLEDFAEADRAQQLYAIALARSDRGPEAVPRLRALVEKAPAHQSAATVAMPLAELLEKRGTSDERIEALGLYRRVASRAPQSQVGKLASKHARRVLRALPKRQRWRHTRPSVEDSFALGDALMRERDYEGAIAQFERLAKWVKDDRTLRCKAELERGRALLRRRQRKEGADLMAKLTKRCRDRDVRAWAHYYAGRARFRLNDDAAALAHYDALPKVAPEHRLADDGLFQGALAAADMKDDKGMRRRLLTLVDEHPNGDMRADGLFLLAWRAYKHERYEEAVQHFERLIAEGPDEDSEGIRGRAAYWRARSLAGLKQTRKAADAYVELIKERPLSYHGRQALQRLSELAPTRARKLLGTILKRDRVQTKVSFAHRAEMDDPAFTGAVALLQVGELERAERVFRHLGTLGPGADHEVLWLVAALFDAAGAYAEASNLSRGRMDDFMRLAPHGRNYGLWRIAFPNAFAPLIEQAAEEQSIPAAFVRAVAREESAFNPEAVSRANAIGLIQLMRPTAREHGAALGLPSHPRALKRPEINLRIGAHFIRFLWSRYRDNPTIVPAAYNAGHGAAERWIRAAPETPVDEWIESIPYEETRRYTRRVLQTYGVYAWLETGELPQLGNRLPLPRRR
ncbi:MAG: transglycosylase SLT domain-containing protein [Myxococcales bacterium]|nr:transglycosylase SLT domain-containing protein [Myxococcales bacterium]